MANSSGTQDLVVNILSADKRYEVSNYKNVTIPTNFDVKDTVKAHFGEFYTSLFDRTLQKNPGAVITEYAWAATPGGMCDPCPPEATLVNNADLALLGGDTVGGTVGQGRFVLTRMHARYTKGSIKDDLVFREAKPIVGGRESRNDNGQLEYGSSSSDTNNFQARYAMRHWWTGAIRCEHPRRGIWGGPWADIADQDQEMIMAKKIAFAPRGKISLPSVVKRDLPEIGVKRYIAPKKIPVAPGPQVEKPDASPAPHKHLGVGLGALAGLSLLAFGLRRRRLSGDRLP
jgi:Uncharacterized protein conserved in bacteria (DUF2330)